MRAIEYPDLYLRAARGVFALSGEEPGTRLWRKELAYPDTFVKVNDRGKAEFELPVDERQIDQWVKTFDEMKADGIPVPVPIGHTTDPEARRGTVERMTKEPSEHPKRKGQPALFCYVRFNSPDDEEQFKNSDVSLYMPPQFTSGKGKTYKRPIRHVALTDYPVVPDLGRFSAVAASHDGFALSLASEEEEMPNRYASLAKRMGLELSEDMDDKACEDAIVAAWEQGGDEEEETPREEEEVDEELSPEEMEGMGSPGDDPDLDIIEDGSGEGDPEDLPPRKTRGGNYDPPPSLAFSFPKSMVNQLVRSRSIEIDSLVKAKKISKPVADRLKKKYCGDKQVCVALSHEMENEGTVGDDFDDIVAALSLNSPVATTGEKSGPQQGGEQLDQQPTVKDAERRAQRFQQRNRR